MGSAELVHKSHSAEGSWFRAHQARRRQIAEGYTEPFAAHDELQLPVEQEDVHHALHVHALRLALERLTAANGQSSEIRNQFIERLKRRNIGTSVHFISIHLHPYYRDKVWLSAGRLFRRTPRIPAQPLAAAPSGDNRRRRGRRRGGRSRHCDVMGALMDGGAAQDHLHHPRPVDRDLLKGPDEPDVVAR
jgi:hypothetical protein